VGVTRVWLGSALLLGRMYVQRSAASRPPGLAEARR
jgi:hypothetical protein